MEQHLLTIPVVRKYEFTTIGTCVVLRFTNIWGIAIKSRTPSIADILVDAITMSIEFEESRNREIFPIGIVIVKRPETCRCILVVLYEMESPHALHRQVTV